MRLPRKNECMDRRGKDSKVNEKRLLCHRRGVIALVASVALAFVIGFGVLGLQPTGTSMGNGPDGASEFAAPVSGNDATSGERDDSFQVSSDSRYGDIETGKVLVHVDGTMSIEQVNSVLGSVDFAVTKDVSGQDATIGFVEVEIDDSVSVPRALDIFEDEGLSAQPNYVYYLAESEQDSVLVEHAASAFDLQTSLQSATATEVAADSTVASVSINDPSAGQEWYLESMDLYKAWGIQTSEQSRNQQRVSVAVIDSGCLVTHEDLKDNIVATYNSVTGAEGPDHVPDDGGHGTHVAGIVSARANNGIGAIGASYNAGLVIVKANDGLDTSGQPAFSTVTLASAYQWFLGDSGNGRSVAERYNLRVVNMSLGGPSAVDADDALYAKITQAREAGILTVCAAGNSGGANATPPYNVIPGDYADCFTVINLRKGSSTTPNDSSGTYYVERSSSSNYNVESGEFAKAKNISAPGTAIYSTLYSGTDQYGEKSGTSMASPATAGVAALMFAYDPSLSAADVQALLEQTATDINTSGWDRETGYGEVDAYHALQVLSAEIALGDVSCGESAELALSCADGSSTPASEWTWTSSDPGVLTVDTATGTAKANMRGAVTLTATHPCGRAISKEVSVEAVDLSGAQVASIDNQLYTGDALEPAISVSLNGQDLVLGTDYTVSFSNNVNVGDVATATVNGIGNYTGTATVTFTILPRSLGEASVQSVDSQTWSGSALTPVPVVRFGSRTLVNGQDFDVVYENNRDAGTARFVITGKGNYTGVIDGEFAIAPRDLSNASVSIASQSYTGKPIEPDAVVTLGGITLVKGIDYIVQYSNNTNAGNATASITGIGNYSGAKDVLFTISGGALSPLMITINNTPVYSGSEVKPGITVRADDGTVLKEHVDYVITGYGNNINAGNNTAYVYVRGKGSYTGDVRASFTIRQASLVSATVGVATQKYTGSQLKPEPTVTLRGYGTLVKGRDYTVSYGENAKVGTGSVTIIGTGNYTGSRKATFVIEANSSSQSTQQNQGSSSSSSTTQKPSQPTDQQSAVTGSWVQSGGRWWFSYDAKTRAAQKKAYPAGEWVTVGGRRYHFDGAGWMHAGWLSLSGRWYWLSSDGAMRTGWHLVGGAWYYMGPDGAMLTGRQKVGDATYYLASSGAMRTGWNLEGSTWYFYDGSGAMAHGWRSVGGTWYFLDKSTGAMRQYWLDDGGQRYFLLSSGAMVTGWARVDGTWYYFGPSGAMQKSRWVGNYYVGSDGKMATSTWVGRYHVNASGLWDATR